jgi:hypothetical protein
VKNDMVPQERIEQKIFLIRGHKVMIDRDLSELYGVETKYINRQVKRNLGRFPREFCFRLTQEERLQLVTICHRFQSMKHSSVCPFAFTEHGVAMLACVLNSKQAIEMSVKKYATHDDKIQLIFEAIKKLLEPMPPQLESKKPPIGFNRD